MDEGFDGCKPDFNAFWDICRYLQPFEHNAQTYLTDKQTDHGTVTSIPIAEIAFSDVA